MKEELVWVLLGIFLTKLLEYITKKFRVIYEKYRLCIRKKVFKGKHLYKYLFKYYSKEMNIKDWFHCKINDFDMIIPFFTSRNWMFNVSLDEFEKNKMIILEKGSVNEGKISYKLINYRKKIGQKIFDAPTLYLDYIEENENKQMNLYVKKCRFYEAFTSLARLEEETYRNILLGKIYYKRSNFRDKYYRNLDTAKNCGSNPNIACACTLILEKKGEKKVLLVKRSNATMSFGGAMAVIPAFSLVPINIEDEIKSTRVLYHNFIKEFLEELFDYEALIGEKIERHADETWFYKLTEAKEFESLYQAGKIDLNVTGFGFDLSNGGAFLSMMCIMKDENYIDKLLKEIKFNWETQDENGALTENAFEILTLDSYKIKNWLEECNYHYGCAFSLFRAIECIKVEKEKFREEEHYG